MFCSKCGKEVEENAQFCAHCGYKLVKGEENIICTNCGISNLLNARFCLNCGAELQIKHETNRIEIQATKLAFVEKVRGFFLDPSKTFDATKGDTIEDAMKYYALIAAIYFVLFASFFLFVGTRFGLMNEAETFDMVTGSSATGNAEITVLFIVFVILIVVYVFIGGAIFHIFVYLVGGRNGITQTIKAVMYGSTPLLLLGWIPIIGAITGIWSLVLEIIGIRQLHGLTTGKAVLAVLIPLIIAGIIILVAVIAAFVFDMGESYNRPTF